VILGLGLSAVLSATPVPEIDPASGTTAIALLSGTLLLVRSAMRKSK